MKKTVNKAPKQKPVWVSAHLFYTGSLDTLLVNAVYPFIENVRKNKRASHFFFIRYHEGGPHIRLRFQLPASTEQTKFKTRIERYFNKWFHENSFVEKRKKEDVSTTKSAIKFIPYEAETLRYGGVHGLKVAEKQFQLSSEIILRILQEQKPWDYGSTLSTAMNLHLAFTHAMGMNLNEACGFFDEFISHWLPFVAQQKTNTRSAALKEEKSLIQGFRLIYKKEQGELKPYIDRLWKNLRKDAWFDEDWFNEWIHEHQKLNGQLLKLQKNKQLLLPDRKIKAKQSFPHSRSKRWPVLGSYMHMTNNRLGLNNFDEILIAFLMKAALEK